MASEPGQNQPNFFGWEAMRQEGLPQKQTAADFNGLVYFKLLGI